MSLSGHETMSARELADYLNFNPVTEQDLIGALIVVCRMLESGRWAQTTIDADRKERGGAKTPARNYKDCPHACDAGIILTTDRDGVQFGMDCPLHKGGGSTRCSRGLQVFSMGSGAFVHRNARHDLTRCLLEHCAERGQEDGPKAGTFSPGGGILQSLNPSDAPIPMILFCPLCNYQHVDRPEPDGDWKNPPHRTHLCHNCGNLWRPADVPTTGVLKLDSGKEPKGEGRKSNV